MKRQHPIRKMQLAALCVWNSTSYRTVAQIERGEQQAYRKAIKPLLDALEVEMMKRDLLAEVRRVVELECPPETDILDTYEEGAYKTCRAILARLAKLDTPRLSTEAAFGK